MKKVFILAALAAATLSSCTTVTQTASTENVDTSIKSYNVADLDVSPKRVTYTYETTAKTRRGGKKNILNTAVQEALKANGGGDVLVAPQFTTYHYRGLIIKKITRVTVSGYPASYKNFRQAPACKAASPCKH